MTAPNRNHLWAGALVDELARAGVRKVVVAPGSRSTPLVLAAAGDRRLEVGVQIDERSAGFLALGVGKGTGVPAAVITTSGTAVANLLPAVVEASQSETPLLLLTADRPPHLRGADANQAIDQVHLFGRYVRMFEELVPGVVSDRTLRHLRSVGSRAAAAAVGDPAGPVHLNVPFAKPLEPTPVPGDVPPGLADEAPLAVEGRSGGDPYTKTHRRRAAPDPGALASLATRLRAARRPVVVAGPLPRPWESGPALRRFAGATGIPVLADVLSGARFPCASDHDAPTKDGSRGGKDAVGGATVVGGYDLALGAEGFRERARPDLILRVGSAPTSAVLARWLGTGASTGQVVIDGGARWKDHLATASEYLPGDPSLTLAGLVEAGWGGSAGSAGPSPWALLWRRAEQAVGEALALERETGGDGFFEGAAVAEVVRRCPEGSVLFVSNSMPVRDLDVFVPGRAAPLPVLGNRGASGIDGIVSTAAGVAWGTGTTVVALLGDLALIHDMNGLTALREAGVRVIVIVVQNDGGGIFHRLPIREHEPEFTRFFATPHGLEVARVADLHQLPWTRADDLAKIGAALETASGWESGGIVEIPADRDESMQRARDVSARVRESVDRAMASVPAPP